MSSATSTNLVEQADLGHSEEYDMDGGPCSQVPLGVLQSCLIGQSKDGTRHSANTTYTAESTQRDEAFVQSLEAHEQGFELAPTLRKRAASEDLDSGDGKKVKLSIIEGFKDDTNRVVRNTDMALNTKIFSALKQKLVEAVLNIRTMEQDCGASVEKIKDLETLRDALQLKLITTQASEERHRVYERKQAATWEESFGKDLQARLRSGFAASLQKKVDDVKVEHDNEIAALHREYAQKIQKVEAAHEKKYEQREEVHKKQIEGHKFKKTAAERSAKDVKAECKRKERELDSEHKKLEKQLNNERDKAIKQCEAEADNKVKELQTTLKTQADEKRSLENKVRGLNQNNEYLLQARKDDFEHRRKAEGIANAKISEVDELRGKIGSLKEENRQAAQRWLMLKNKAQELDGLLLQQRRTTSALRESNDRNMTRIEGLEKEANRTKAVIAALNVAVDNSEIAVTHA